MSKLNKLRHKPVLFFKDIFKNKFGKRECANDFDVISPASAATAAIATLSSSSSVSPKPELKNVVSKDKAEKDNVEKIGYQKSVSSLTNSGNLAKAIQNIKIALAKNPKDEYSLTKLLVILRESGRYDEFDRYLAYASENYPHNTLIKLEELKASRERGGFNKCNDEKCQWLISNTDNLEIKKVALRYYRESKPIEELVSIEGFPWGLDEKYDGRLFAELASIYFESGDIKDCEELILEIHNKKEIKYASKYPLMMRHAAAELNVAVGTVKERLVTVGNVLDDSKQSFHRDITRAKTIAIVGNSPREYGKKLGGEIDGHELVVRFNNFPATEDYYKCYGRKTDVWVRSIGSWVIPRSVDDFRHCVLSGINLDYRGFSTKPFKAYFDKQASISTFDGNLMMELIKYLGAPPSAGLMAIFLVYKLRGGLSDVDLYGFGFIDQLESSIVNVGNSPAGVRHDWHVELDFLHKMINGQV